MPVTWLYVVGGIVISIVALAIAYNLISQAINTSLRQSALKEFSDLKNDVENVCTQEIKNFVRVKFTLYSKTRVVYATDYPTYIMPTVIDSIKNSKKSSGSNICMQFTDEQDKIRCEKLACDLDMPYIGTLPESEDIWSAVNKILGRANVKEYDLTVKKVSGDVVEISIG